MSKPGTPSDRNAHGEATIRKALIRSLLAILLLAGIASVVWWFSRPQAVVEAPAPIEVSVPVEVAPAVGNRPPAVHFKDITEESGINFVHVNGAFGDRLIPETIGSGVAFFDYDNDGDQDLFLVNFRYWPDHPGTIQPNPGQPNPAQSNGQRPTQALYRNDGSGRFEDVSTEAGLAIEEYGMGVAIGDYDGDGWRDLFLTSLHGNRLFRNDHGRFREVTAEAGVGGDPRSWSTGAAFFDYDGDGDLDLFVANYVDWSADIDREIDFRLAGLGRAYGAPNHFNGTDNVLYSNLGDGTFEDVSVAAGIQVHDEVSGLPVGKGLGVAPVDYDRDGHVDLLVTNDTVRNFLYHNFGDGRFEEVGTFEGIAYDRQGKATGGMGIDVARYRNDQDLGILIGNFANEMSSLFVTVDGGLPFADEAVLEGIGPASRQALTFGVLFLDVDLDGRLDLLQANGHLEHEINKVQPSQHYAQPAQLFWNCGSACRGCFQPVTDPGDLSQPMVGRGAAYADIDNDGDLDLVISQNGRAARLFRNDQDLGHHWLRLQLIGKAPNRDAIGARIALRANGISQYRRLMPSRSFISQVALAPTFGLGDATRVDAIDITWPDGSQQTVQPEGVDRELTVVQE
jgi:hypothetical protein